MIRYSTLFLLVLLAFRTSAQITITDADMPVTGIPYYLDNAINDSIIDLSVTGANQIWDYTQLTDTVTDTIEYVGVTTTPFLYQLFFNNIIVYSDWKADLALPATMAAIPGSMVTITDVYNYFKVTTAAYYMVGFGATINAVPTSQRYDPRDKLLTLPNTFGLIDSADFAWLLSVPGLGAYGQVKTRTNETDGWGTLMLPNANYNTLRVKSTLVGIDTFHVDQFNFGFAFPSTQYEYRWYANGTGEPVLTVTAADIAGNPTITSARFRHDLPAGVPDQNGPIEKVSFGPNPVSDILYVHYKSLHEQNITISIYDITGKCVLNQQDRILAGVQNTLQYALNSFSKGYYTVKVSGKEGVFGRKLVIY